MKEITDVGGLAGAQYNGPKFSLLADERGHRFTVDGVGLDVLPQRIALAEPDAAVTVAHALATPPIQSTFANYLSLRHP
jgi:hypothetical protein